MFPGNYRIHVGSSKFVIVVGIVVIGRNSRFNGAALERIGNPHVFCIERGLVGIETSETIIDDNIKTNIVKIVDSQGERAIGKPIGTYVTVDIKNLKLLISEEDIKKIERETLKEKIALKRNMIDMELEDEMKPADYLFIYYFDYKENKSYVRRDMYEIFKSKGIEIEGNPKVIDSKNCYSITENELKEVESKIGYRGVEQLLKPNKELVIPKPVLDYPNQDVLKGVVDNLNNFTNQQREKLKEERKNNKSLIETLLVYQDKNTHKLYIPVSKVGQKDQQTFMIMNKPCYETNFGELEQYSNYKIVIADVYTTKKEKYDIIICNNNGQFYISKDMLEKLGFYIENPHKILVNKEIYEEITEDDIDLIKGKDSESCQINIIIKQIAPKRG